jgi:hypothetical protein
VEGEWAMRRKMGPEMSREGLGRRWRKGNQPKKKGRKKKGRGGVEQFYYLESRSRLQLFLREGAGRKSQAQDPIIWHN